MLLSERIRSARKLIDEARSQQRALVQRAWDDDRRSLTTAEGEMHDALEVDVKALETEIRMLEEQLELEAAMAKAPRSNADE